MKTIPGTCIAPTALADRWLGGDSIAALAADVELSAEVVEAAIRQWADERTQAVMDMTPGMQPRQPSKDVGELPVRPTPERWDKSQPATVMPAYLCAPCNLEVEVGETFGHCPRCSKPMEMNPRFMSTKA